MSGLTNEYVENLGKLICGETFLGTFPCDILPDVSKKKKFSLIINLSNITQMEVILLQFLLKKMHFLILIH